jgi:hypothetical protein
MQNSENGSHDVRLSYGQSLSANHLPLTVVISFPPHTPPHTPPPPPHPPHPPLSLKAHRRPQCCALRRQPERSVSAKARQLFPTWRQALPRQHQTSSTMQFGATPLARLGNSESILAIWWLQSQLRPVPKMSRMSRACVVSSTKLSLALPSSASASAPVWLCLIAGILFSKSTIFVWEVLRLCSHTARDPPRIGRADENTGLPPSTPATANCLSPL